MIVEYEFVGQEPLPFGVLTASTTISGSEVSVSTAAEGDVPAARHCLRIYLRRFRVLYRDVRLPPEVAVWLG